MSRLRVVICAVLTLAVLPGEVLSQSIGTDRPDFVESSSTVGKGSIQIEGAVAFGQTQVNDTEVSDWTTPVLFRVGITNDWELRVESPWFVSSRFEDGEDATEVTTSGVSDFAVGVKWAFFSPETGNAPSMAALVHATLPTGSEDFRGDGTRPSLRVVAEWAIDDWAIGVMPGVVYDRGDRGRFVSGLFGAVVSKGITDSVRGFVEFALNQITEDKYGGNLGFIDFGGTFLLNPRWQLDAGVAVGLTDQSQDLGFTLGLSGLFPRPGRKGPSRTSQ